MAKLHASNDHPTVDNSEFEALDWVEVGQVVTLPHLDLNGIEYTYCECCGQITGSEQ